jgi:hypothetical protein
MDSLRKYFVLKRLQNAACEYHFRPTEVKLNDKLEIAATWGEVVAPISKRRALRDDNVAASTDDLEKAADLLDTEDQIHRAARVALPMETPKEWHETYSPDNPKGPAPHLRDIKFPEPVKRAKKVKAKKGCPCGCDEMERYKDYRPCGNYQPPDNPCECGCQDRVRIHPHPTHRSNYRDPDNFRCRMYRARGDCIFAARCSCGCEDGLTEEEWRELRRTQCMEQTDAGWNIWDREKDEQLRSLLRQQYYLQSKVSDYEETIAGGINPTKMQLDRVDRYRSYAAAIEQKIASRRAELAERMVEREEEGEPESEERPLEVVYSGPFTLEDITKSRLPREQLIDGMCVALQRCHTLRILHRNVRLDNFAVQHYVDEAGADAVADHSIDEDDDVIVGTEQWKLEDLPRHKPVVVLRGWDHACFNPGNTAFRNSVAHKFAFPDWGEIAPEMSGDAPEHLEYGFEYDMWCLGLCIFELLYERALWDEVDPAEFTDAWLEQWIAAHPLGSILGQNASLYSILLKVILTTDPKKRACSYAAMNMTDGPRNPLFEQKMAAVAERQDHGILAWKFPMAPDVGRMLSHWVRDPDGLIDKLRAHDYTPHALNPNAGHWRGCLCRVCKVQVHTPELEDCLDENKHPLRNETTRVMYGLMHASTASYRNLKGHQLIALFSQLADSILTDRNSRRIDLERFEFGSEREFRKALAESAQALQDLRIRL